MVITIVISMLIVMSCHTIAIVVCSKKSKQTLEAKKSVENNVIAAAPTPTTPAKTATPVQAPAAAAVDRDENDSTRTKVGGKKKKKSSDEQDSTDDAFADLAARLKNKDAEKTGDNSLFGDDDENPMAQFQMPERPVVDPKADGVKLQQMVELEKKPASPAPTPASKLKPAPGRSVMPGTLGSLTAKEVSQKGADASKKKKMSKNRAPSKREDTGVERTQSAERDKKMSGEIEKTQGSDDEEEQKAEPKEKKTQRLSLMGSVSNRRQKKELKSKG